MYDHKNIEKKWQKYWEENKTYKIDLDINKKKFYSLVEFPYPCLLYTSPSPRDS